MTSLSEIKSGNAAEGLRRRELLRVQALAITASVAVWEEKLAQVAAGEYPVDGFSNAGCPCCGTFLEVSSSGRLSCGACPIKELTGKDNCHDTPFYNARACTDGARCGLYSWDPQSEAGLEATGAVTEEVQFLKTVESRVQRLLEEVTNENA